MILEPQHFEPGTRVRTYTFTEIFGVDPETGDDIARLRHGTILTFVRGSEDGAIVTDRKGLSMLIPSCALRPLEDVTPSTEARA